MIHRRIDLSGGDYGGDPDFAATHTPPTTTATDTLANGAFVPARARHGRVVVYAEARASMVDNAPSIDNATTTWSANVITRKRDGQIETFSVGGTAIANKAVQVRQIETELDAVSEVYVRVTGVVRGVGDQGAPGALWIYVEGDVRS